MKKVLLVMAAFVFGCVFIAGCGGGSDNVANKELADEFKDAPAWVLGGGMEGGNSAVGSAKVGNAGMNFYRTEAMAHARSELARQLGVKVKDLVKNFQQVTGIGDDETVDKVSSQVSKQVTSQVLTGSKQKDMWISPSKELYVLMAIDPDILKNMVRDSVQTSYKNEKALWQKFQAQKAHEELDKEIEKEFGEFKDQ